MPHPNADFFYCLNCRYHLRGLTENRCPECGTPFDPDDSRLLRYAPHTRVRGWISFLTMTHLFAAMLILFTLILPYHLSGRAAFDYGWDVPGKGQYGYDPSASPPYNWPGLGLILQFGGFVSVFTFFLFAPFAPFFAIATFVLMKKNHFLLPPNWSRQIAAFWILTTALYLYMLLNASNVIDWYFD
jgi:hypothetical protein